MRILLLGQVDSEMSHSSGCSGSRLTIVMRTTANPQWFAIFENSRGMIVLHRSTAIALVIFIKWKAQLYKENGKVWLGRGKRVPYMSFPLLNFGYEGGVA